MPEAKYRLIDEINLVPISLTVSDLNRSLSFYHDILGLELRNHTRNQAVLGTEHSPELILLTENPRVRLEPGRTGLYHFALRLPNRQELAHALASLLEADWPLEGYSDHGVSEAVYLADPDQNGIEIYRDRPRDHWPVVNGQLQMVTDPLDIQGLMSELDGQKRRHVALPSETSLGHIHLRVASISKSEEFYCGVLGFQLMQRFGNSAGFVSTGGYHHHIGFNTWQSAGAQPPSPEAAGLRYFGLRLPDNDALQDLLKHLQSRGIHPEAYKSGYLVRDPSYNAIMISG
jgi:catechol 2,3-dioxygenase